MGKRNPSEHGQIMILLALGILGLLGFTALALDGGMIYAHRRHAQNGADAAAMAGGGAAGLILHGVDHKDFACTSSALTLASNKARQAAVAQAPRNDFAIQAAPYSQATPGENEVATECVVLNNGSFLEKYLDVKVKISDGTPTSLIQYVYSGPVRNTVDAVARVFPTTSLAYGNAIVALSPQCHGSTGGVTFDGGGNSTITVNGGGVFSNACLEANGSSLDICIDKDYMNPAACDGDGDMTYITNYTVSGSPVISSTVSQGNPDARIPRFAVTPPDCTRVPIQGQHSGAGTISPGRYSKIKLTNGVLKMEPGLYCLSGDFKVTGGELKVKDPNEGVTIYMASGDFTTSGNVMVQLAAPPVSCQGSYCPPAIPGMLIFMAEGNAGVVTMQGTSSSWYTGTVYAPDGKIDLGGTSSQLPTFNTQLVGWTVKVHGNVTIDINFDDQVNYKHPATLELNR